MSSAAQPEKFQFDRDLARVRKRTRTLAEEDFDALIEQTRQQAYAEGHAAGEKSATVKAAEALAQAANKLATNGINLVEAMAQRERNHRDEAVELAASVARRLAAHLVVREPVAELEALWRDCLASLERAPHVVIRCHPDIADAVKQMAEQHASERGYAGRLVIMGDPDILLGDGRIEWNEGGIARDSEAISAEINKKLHRFIMADRPAGETGPDTETAGATAPAGETEQ
ncbi:FliH/SctL family protein [Cucumibacter marinus]|uniref:FliH/SctL family protein n=1 Tax=Cucumibacter marinus TaxID=1121252 RepID=UPI00040C91C2|nr:FliH/SctL family protein [Cucumibacter marinus]